MAKAKKLWSINALALEMGVDRRTMGSRLRNVPPRGKRNGHDAWYLSDAVDACAAQPVRGPFQASVIPRPPGFELLAPFEGNDVTAGMAMAFTLACCKAPRLVAVAATKTGAPMKVAYTMSNFFLLLLMASIDEILAGVVPDAEFAVDSRQMEEIDWKALAEQAGEKFDVPAWKAYQKETMEKISEGG